MSTLSVFAFERKSFQQAGPFRQSHAKLNDGPGLFWEGMWEIPATHAVFAYVRSDTEIAQSLSGALNTDSVLNFLDQQFKDAPARRVCQSPELLLERAVGFRGQRHT